MKINIYGKVAEGKTTVAKIIADALTAAGIACEVDDGYDGDYGQFHNTKLDSLKKKNPLVKIEVFPTINPIKYSREEYNR